MITGPIGIVEDIREASRAQIVAGLQENRTPAQIARSLMGVRNRITNKYEGGTIGLAANQVDMVLEIQAGFNAGDRRQITRYLELENRDKIKFTKFAKAVRSDGWDVALEAFNKGRREKLTKAQMLSRITFDMRDRALKFRATRISRDQGITALRAGRHEGYRQMLDTGVVREDQIERTWDAANDDKTRLSHAALEGQKVPGMSQPFVSPVTGARMMFPGDQSLGAPASELIQCRCMERVRIRYIR